MFCFNLCRLLYIDVNHVRKMLIKKCKAPTFAQNSALWCAHLCSQ